LEDDLFDDEQVAPRVDLDADMNKEHLNIIFIGHVGTSGCGKSAA
jgi:hypothetical protein